MRSSANAHPRRPLM